MTSCDSSPPGHIFCRMNATCNQSEMQLFCNCGFEETDIVEIRLLPSGKRAWHTAAELPEQFDELKQLNARGENIYVGANPRQAVGGSTSESVALARCLFVDFDGISIEDAKWTIEGADLPVPTMYVESGHGVHAWWRLTTPLDNLSHWTAIQKQLIQAVKSDPAIHDPARIMRVPGFDNCKAEPVPCRVFHGADPQRRYSLAKILENLPAFLLPTVSTVDSNNVTINRVTDSVTSKNEATAGDYQFTLQRAAAYIAQIETTIEGNGRNRGAFKVAAAVVNDYQLNDADAWQLLTAWNSGNKPPLDEAELKTTFQSAKKNAKHPPGEKLNGRASGYSLTINGRPIGGHNGNGSGHSLPPPLEAAASDLRPILFGELADEFPTLRQPIVHGLLRCGEIGNIVSVSKVGKSWLAAHLALCIITGRRFLNTFDCEPGRVLLIDNELHRETIRYRVAAVAEAMGIPADVVRIDLDVLPLRGERLDLFGLARVLDKLEAGGYQLALADAWYRIYPPNVSENDNAAVMTMYNELDAIAAKLRCGWINVHHSSKGSQGEKRISDVGSGAGAQSRAADSHLILREHETPGVVVFDGVVRSFPPCDPLVLRWEYPLWLPDNSLDPEKLKGRLTVGERRQGQRDNEGIGKLASALVEGPATASVLRGKSGLSRDRCQRLLDVLESEGAVRWTETTVRGNPCRLYEAVKEHDEK